MRRPGRNRTPSPRGLGLPPGAPSLLFRLAHGSYRIARRLVIGIVGATVLILGVLMFFTPGPAILVIPIGLGILALEFVWARRLLRLFRVRARQATRAWRRGDRQYWRKWFRRR